jgi:hypothetical protein
MRVSAGVGKEQDSFFFMPAVCHEANRGDKRGIFDAASQHLGLNLNFSL